jgi:isoleucyl-tRNA synthetase
VDITKDRMYCDAVNSGRRRATQAAMHEIFRALCQLLAPVLAFTADEAWQYVPLAGPGSMPPATTSVHVEEFPQPKNRGSQATEQVSDLLKLRAVIGQAIEKARQEKLIGNALEAAVVLTTNADIAAKIDKSELEEFFILSDLTIEQGSETAASVKKTSFAKCARCWRHREHVGKSKTHPELCDRCEDVVTKRL